MTVQNNLELQGNFVTHPFAEIVVEVTMASLSGSLRLSHEDKKSIIYFDNGQVVFAVSNARKLKLLDVLRSFYTEKASGEMTRFGNDLELLEHLRNDSSLSEGEVDDLLKQQLNAIIMDVLSWPNGDWKFDPLARARGDIRAEVNLPSILLSYARSLAASGISERFRSYTEMFAEVPDAELRVDLDPTEAFLYSRLHGAPQMVKDLIDVSGMEENLVLKTLYSLWLAGLLVRSDWSPAFSPRKIAAIRSATLVLKKSAATIAKSATKPEPATQPDVKPAKPEPVIPLDQYLKRVEGADSLYAVLGLAQDCTLAAIRKSYFGLAKQFHPDKFHRGDAKLLRRVEVAFSTLAQSYETLKEPKSRELYDSKLKRERAERANRDSSEGTSATGHYLHSERAAQEFEHGRGLLMEGNWEEALPYLARAVHFVGDNARYHAMYGKALSHDEGQRHRAVNAMQKAVSLDPQNAAFRMMLAEFLVKVNLIKRAEGELNRLLALQPDHEEARSLLDSLSRK